MKSVTMIVGTVKEFREEGLTESIKGLTLKLYAAPYTLHELGGLIESVLALQKSKFPKSQLYQIRSLLQQGKQTAILNYRYFRVRLAREQQILLKNNFENPWCKAQTNDGNLAPWMFDKDNTAYETIWRDLVDIYDFIEPSEKVVLDQKPATSEL